MIYRPFIQHSQGTVSVEVPIMATLHWGNQTNRGWEDGRSRQPHLAVRLFGGRWGCTPVVHRVISVYRLSQPTHTHTHTHTHAHAHARTHTQYTTTLSHIHTHTLSQKHTHIQLCRSIPYTCVVYISMRSSYPVSMCLCSSDDDFDMSRYSSSGYSSAEVRRVGWHPLNQVLHTHTLCLYNACKCSG